jgi:hypothetical protein
MSHYIRSLSINFPNGLISWQLSENIIAVITSPKLITIHVSGNNVDIIFESPLPDTSILDTIITNYQPISLTVLGPTGPTGPIATGPTGPIGPTGIVGSYLVELSSTGTYSWSLNQNIVYVIGVTTPSSNLISLLTPSTNSYWQINNNGLKYIGLTPIYINYMISMNFNSGSNNKAYLFNLLLNGSTIPNTLITYNSTATNPYIITYTKVVQVSTNDILRVNVTCTSSGGDVITMRYYTLSVFT